MSNSPFKDPDVLEFLKDVPTNVQRVWVKVFGPDIQWIESEILKAWAWRETNPDRLRIDDGIPRFVNAWLSRAFANKPKHRPPPGIDPQPLKPDRYRTGAIDEIKKVDEEFKGVKPDPERVRALIRSITGGKGLK
jgi:hypothetical protein